jgi:RNA polymerase sigma factor (sigma-70 family)
MTLKQNAALAKEIETVFNVGAVRELTDGQLLERFATDRGESAELAFAVLVERHGRMVLRVCLSVLADSHDTEDAFQAVFLVLVQKARGLWVRDSLGPWLHQVAFRTACRARVAAARRRRHEARGAGKQEEARAVNSDDLGGLLHEEIERLPERYRAPVVLCDLEGRSHEQAARHLGWPLGTVKSRQARGRERLRDRLRRRGLAPDVTLLGSGPVSIGPDPVLSPALVESTTRSVVQFVTCRSAVEASTISLAQGVLQSMSITRWSKVASVLLVVGATVSGAGIFARRQWPAAAARVGNMVSSPRADELITTRVKPGSLVVTFLERGSLEAARVTDIFSAIEGTTTILSIVPEGTSVTKGAIICELDSASLRDELVKTQIAVQSAESDYQKARIEREVAEIALKEYTELKFNNELNSVKGEVAAAQSGLQRAETRLDRTRRARRRLFDVLASKKGAVAPADIIAELDVEDRVEASEQAVSRENSALVLAKSRQLVLEKYTKDKTSKSLVLEVEQKRSVELAKRASWELQKSKAKAIDRQIAACTITAPVAGRVVRASDHRRGLSQINPQIEEGATVRERQKIVSLLDPAGPTQVSAKVHGSRIDKIVLGMKVKIRVDAFPTLLFNGEVVEVNPLPDAPILDPSNAKVYTTKVKIDNGIPGLRPGMTAQVEFLVAVRDNVLSVPVQSVVVHEGKDRVAVRKPGGGIEWREVTVGLSNEKFVEITQGIAAGDTVILNPLPPMSDREKPKEAGAPPEANRPR